MKNEEKKTALMEELQYLCKKGVDFSMEGESIYPDNGFVDMLLAEDECTYMRNYIFKGSEVIGIDFNKISLI